MRPGRRLAQTFWGRDQGLTILLVLLVVFLILHPIVAAYALPRILVQLLFSMILVSGVASVARWRSAAVFASLLAAGSLVVSWASHLSPSPALAIANAALSVAFCGGLALVILAQVFAIGPVTRHRIEGAIAVYLLIGITWAFAFKVVELVDPTAFTFGARPAAGTNEGLSLQLAYLSFITLTTVGYGDVTPLSEVARMLAVFEALIGQLFPAILLARLVSLELYYKQSRSHAPSDDVDE